MVENHEELEKKVNEYEQRSNQQNNYNSGNNYNKPKSRNLWTDNNIKSLSLSVIQKYYGDLSFSVYFKVPEESVPEDIQKKLSSAVEFLGKKGYTFRSWYPGESQVGKVLVNRFLETGNKNIEWYLVSKKYNEAITEPTSYVNKEMSFQLARGAHTGWDKIPGFVRALCARDIEVMLSNDCKKPLRFILIYSPCGSEVLPEKPDYKSLGGSLAFILKVAKTLSIPVFNLQNEGVGKRLMELVNGKAKAEEPEEEKPAVQEDILVEEPDQVPSTTEVKQESKPTEGEDDFIVY